MNKEKFSCAGMELGGFADALASSAPTPGGGGASAVAGALGAALGSMVCSLTVGKKKYEAVEADIREILGKTEKLRTRLLALADRDAEVFAPLAKAYGMPKDDPSRPEVMESALKTAVSAPLEIMGCCCEAIVLHEQLAVKGSALAVSDVGVGALFCLAALRAAALNVYVNTRLMTDRAFAGEADGRADDMLAAYGPRAENVYQAVTSRLREKDI